MPTPDRRVGTEITSSSCSVQTFLNGFCQLGPYKGGKFIFRDAPDSGYTLIGKVGGINEEEAENFDLDEIPAEEGDLDLDLEDEATDEAAVEGDEDLDLDLDSEEDAELNLDLDLDLGEEEEEETNEPLLQPIEEKVNFDEIERL